MPDSSAIFSASSTCDSDQVQRRGVQHAGVELGADRVADLGHVVADRVGQDAGEEVEVAAALAVGHPAAVPAGDLDRLLVVQRQPVRQHGAVSGQQLPMRHRVSSVTRPIGECGRESGVSRPPCTTCTGIGPTAITFVCNPAAGEALMYPTVAEALALPVIRRGEAAGRGRRGRHAGPGPLGARGGDRRHRAPAARRRTGADHRHRAAGRGRGAAPGTWTTWPRSGAAGLVVELVRRWSDRATGGAGDGGRPAPTAAGHAGRRRPGSSRSPRRWWR